MRGFTAWQKELTGRLEGSKSNAQALSQGIILFALIVCFLVFGGLNDFFSGYWIWHTYRPTWEFIAQTRLGLFLRYEMIGFGIANFCVMASAYLIMQICRPLFCLGLAKRSRFSDGYLDNASRLVKGCLNLTVPVDK